jgi:all-trans-retinol 13,14-reductase
MTSRDAIVVGSGVSGLAAACLLAEAGLRTTVLEQHSVAGGLLQRFRRKGIPFDTGFHYVGGAGEGGPLERYLRRLGVLERLALTPLDPDGFDEIHLPGRRFAFPVGISRIASDLGRAFPGEREAAARFLGRLGEEAASHPLFSFASDRMDPLLLREAGGKTVSEAISDCGVRDPDLRALLGAHSVLYGVPADRAPFEAHALVCSSYYHSAHGLEGGGEALVRVFAERLRELGGELRLRTPVRRICVRDRRVTAVETEGGETIPVGLVVSTAHPKVTVGLLRDDDLPARRTRRIAGASQSSSAILVHALVRGVPPDQPRRNVIRFSAAEHGWADLPPWVEADRDPPVLAVLPASPTPEARGATVFQVFCPTRWDGGEGSREEWRRRKARVARRIVPLVEECLPAWKGRIEVLDVSTPIAIRHFVRSPEGACYGAECSVGQWGPRRLPSRIGIEGLRLAGQSVGLPGVLGSIVTAFVAAAPELGGIAETYFALRRVPAAG